MKNSSFFKVSPHFLKKIDKVTGRVCVELLPKPDNKKYLEHITSVLIIRPGGIGDAALVAPLIATLKSRHESATVDVLAEQRNAGVFDLIPNINNLLLYDKPVDILRVLQRRYDLVIDTEQWHYLSAVIARLTRADIIIGFSSNRRSRLFTHAVSYSHDDYEAQSFLNLLTPLEIRVCFNPAVNFLSIPVKHNHEYETITEKLSVPGYISIFPGASIPERLWGVDKFSRLASLLREDGFLPVVVGGKAEKRAGDVIVADGGINFAGTTTLAGSAYIVSRSRLLVSGDSGIIHIAAGFGIPTVAIFGPGISAKWAPRGENSMIIDKKLACSPCTRFGYTPRCAHNVDCMAGISVEEVFAAATALLNKTEFNVNMPIPISGQGGK